jgi:branched-chain amino acid transport system substrate-binding protein
MKNVMKIFLVLCMTLSLVACSSNTKETGSTDKTNEAKPTTTVDSTGTNGATTGGDTILIGCLQDISGKTATLGKMIQAGTMYAIDEINAAGGVDGKKLQLITRDTTGDVTEAVNAFELLCTQDKVSAIIGPPTSNIGLAIAPISEKYNIPVLGFAIDTATLHNDAGVTYKNMFLFQPSDEQQGAIMAKYAVEEIGASKIGIIYRNDNAYSVGLTDAFKNYIAGTDAEIVKEVQFTSNDTDFSTMLMKIINSGVDIIYAPNYTQELITIVQQARAIGYEGPMICGLDAAPPFASLAEDAANGIVYINNITESDEEVAGIMADYKSKSNTDATNKFFLGYDVVYVLAETFKTVGTESSAVRDAIEKMQGYEGLTGVISMDSATHQLAGLEMYIHEIQEGQSVMIKKYSAE